MFPISDSMFKDTVERLEIFDISTATIRQISGLSAELENITGEKFVHLELGNPGLTAETVGIEAECRALRSGVANKYPDIAGLPRLKKAASRFVKAFLDLDIPPKCIAPTVGSMQACYTLLTLLKSRVPGKDTLLLFQPGFPAQRHQAKILGMEVATFDIYDYRGKKLKDKLDEMLSGGKITAMLYSNPNNPTWSNFTREELEIIGEAATKYNVVVIEDLAYMGMDFRDDCSVPFHEPYIPTVGKYTDNYILMVSASKIFSYAGQRIAVVCMSPHTFNRKYPELESFYEMPNFGECYIYGVLYTASSGATHSAQYALAEMFEKATDGELLFLHHTREYASRSRRLKDLFLKHGFHIVYDKDGERDIADGFFFTVGYRDMESRRLQAELMKFGISCISLPCTGSTKPGIRACVSMLNDNGIFDMVDDRLRKFNETHGT